MTRLATTWGLNPIRYDNHANRFSRRARNYFVIGLPVPVCVPNTPRPSLLPRSPSRPQHSRRFLIRFPFGCFSNSDRSFGPTWKNLIFLQPSAFYFSLATSHSRSFFLVAGTAVCPVPVRSFDSRSVRVEEGAHADTSHLLMF